jgi:hypothetical protein
MWKPSKGSLAVVAAAMTAVAAFGVITSVQAESAPDLSIAGIGVLTSTGRVVTSTSGCGVGASSGGSPISAAVADGGGWLLFADGSVRTVGDAPWNGDLAGVRLKGRPVDIVPTPSHQGYWILGSDGGVFTFGDAPFVGSAGSLTAVRAIAMASTTSGNGYWILERDGRVRGFGDAVSFGAALIRRPVEIAAAGDGYVIGALDGSVEFHNSTPSSGRVVPMLAAEPVGISDVIGLVAVSRRGEVVAGNGAERVSDTITLRTGERAVAVGPWTCAPVTPPSSLPPSTTPPITTTTGPTIVYIPIPVAPATTTTTTTVAPVISNLALAGTASQSSVDFAGGPALGNDGNTDGAYFNGSVMHTGSEASAWWEVDLGASRTITSVRVWNRTDCCFERSTSLRVYVSATPFASNDTVVLDDLASTNVRFLPGPLPANYTLTFPGGVTGRYVRIQRANDGLGQPIHLAEVQVFGS